MITEKFVRKSFPVEAVRVTEANLEEVAAWCSGHIHPRGRQRYIKVNVDNAITEKQKQAFVGDWVLYVQGKNFKVYTDPGFRNTFDEQGVPGTRVDVGPPTFDVADVAEAKAQNVFTTHDGVPGVTGFAVDGNANPGGTPVV